MVQRISRRQAQRSGTLAVLACTAFLVVSTTSPQAAHPFDVNLQEARGDSVSLNATSAKSLDHESASRTGVLPLPILYYTPETGVAGGAALLGLYHSAAADTSARPSSAILDLIYTQKKQIIAEVFPDIFLNEGTYRITGMLHFSRYPQKFYGIGNNTPDSLEEPYSSRMIRVSVEVLRRVAGSLSGGLSWQYENRTLADFPSDGLLGPGTITGSHGGKIVAAGVVLHLDTRDNLFAPTAGRYYVLSLQRSTARIGSDFDFTSFTLDLREYLGISEKSVLAVQAIATMTAGEVPFYMLAQLGGSTVMRGYYEGRYRDNNLVAAQVEYRFPIFGRFGGTTFAGAGDVATEVDRFAARTIKPCLGLGLRYFFDPVEKLNIRLDFGFGKKTSGMYITASEAF